MADQKMPNEASRKSKAEGERFAEKKDDASTNRQSDHLTDEQGGGITNRPLDEEVANQDALPERGESQYGAHAGHGDSEAGERKREER